MLCSNIVRVASVINIGTYINVYLTFCLQMGIYCIVSNSNALSVTEYGPFDRLGNVLYAYMWWHGVRGLWSKKKKQYFHLIRNKRIFHKIFDIIEMLKVFHIFLYWLKILDDFANVLCVLNCINCGLIMIWKKVIINCDILFL